MARVLKFPDEDKNLNTYIYDKYHHDLNWLDGWDGNSKKENFERMAYLPELTQIPFNGTSCLDVGCGTGDLSAWLRKKGIRRYLGVDIYEPSVKKAKIKYPDEEFKISDILTGEITEKFDYAFCSGALTLKLHIDNYNFLESMVEKMWDLTKVGIVFNILTTDPTPDPDLFFYDKEKVLEICKNIAEGGHVVTVADTHKEQSHYYLYR